MGLSELTQSLRVLISILVVVAAVDAHSDTNGMHEPCGDAKIQRWDGFTFGIAFASRLAFYLNQNQTQSHQLSPCDRRLALSSTASQIAVFRPKVDEISLITINTTGGFFPGSVGGYMVAFAGRKYAARSPPAFVANDTYIVTSFTLVLEFEKGRLQNLYWKREGCSSCSGSSELVCINGLYCGIKTSRCKSRGGLVDCTLGIQVAFSGTDKHYRVLNSWYEVEKLRQYSLYGLYSNLKDSLTSQFNKFF